MDELEAYEKAGKIAADILKRSRSLVKVGNSLLETAETIEGWILEKAEISFPVNISINNHAAHYTPSFDDEAVFTENDVVKVDVGTHVNGFIGDNAYTVDLSGENGKLVEASREALNEAISIIKAGTQTNEIGRVVEKKILEYGFKPVKNLSGHLLGEYKLHSGLSVPNVHTKNSFEIKEGMVIAIEPFASTGDGLVKEAQRVEIFSYEKDVPLRNKTARDVLKFAKERYRGLPFAERWLAKRYQPFMLKIAMRELMRSGAFETYPILRDRTGSLVSQAEVTVLIEPDSCKVLT